MGDRANLLAGGADVLARAKGGSEVVIGPLTADDVDPLFALFTDVVEHREGFPHEPPVTPDMFTSVWRAPGVTVVRAREPRAGALLGAYYLRPNFAGRGAHIANAGYVVARQARGAGVGRLLVEDSVRRAPVVGYDAVQFNLVFESNPARRLYESLGWRVIGRIPGAIDGEDALIYWRAV